MRRVDGSRVTPCGRMPAAGLGDTYNTLGGLDDIGGVTVGLLTIPAAKLAEHDDGTDEAGHGDDGPVGYHAATPLM